MEIFDGIELTGKDVKCSFFVKLSVAFLEFRPVGNVRENFGGRQSWL